MGVLLNTLGRVQQTRNLRKLLGDVCTILDTLEGIGCSIDRTGNRWKINVSGATSGLLSTDLPEDVAGTASAGTGSQASRDDHVHKAPHWNEMQNAEANTTIHPDTDDSYDLELGDNLPTKRWAMIRGAATESVAWLIYGSGSTDAAGLHSMASGSRFVIYGDGVGELTATGGLYMGGIPSSSSGLSTGFLFTQTATELGGSGSTKVLCIV